MKEKLQDIGFIVQTNQNNKLNHTILERYGNLPKDYLIFLTDLENCVAKDEKSWFNTIGDFNGTTENGFRWNEFELMILEDYEDETDEDAKEIIDFWNKHIPILMSCRNFYCYFAISLHSDNYGQIVYGNEPIFEETEFVADNFLEFMDKLTNKTLDKKYLEQII
ncbi:SMI1/KNR4 family protein [Sphingobacterium detergens]